MGYAHVQRGVRLDSKGCLNFEQRSKDVLGEGREVAEVISVSSNYVCSMSFFGSIVGRATLHAQQRQCCA